MPRKVFVMELLAGIVAGVLITRLHFSIGSLLARMPFLQPDRALIGYRGWLLAAIAIYAILGTYWDAAAKRASQAKTSETKASRRVHVALVTSALMLEIAPIRGLGRAWPVAWPVMAVGLLIECAGFFVAVWARRHLGSYWSGEITIKVEHQLIRSGPYRLLRHPIYTGLLAMYLGIALVTGERLAIMGLAMAIFAYWRKIRLEEANLRAAFGLEYDGYCRGTWALVPGVY